MSYQGKINTGTKTFLVSGIVPAKPTKSQIKQEVIRDIKRQIEEYKAAQNPPPTTITVGKDSIFKVTL